MRGNGGGAMHLIDELERRLAEGPGIFRAQLLREDLARLRKLDQLARTAADGEDYRRAGRRLGWTAQDARTHELGDALDRLLESVRTAAIDPAAGDQGPAMLAAWQEMTRRRLESMVGCLSTPPPKPED